MSKEYVHGYSDIEARRLRDQADTLVQLLHHDTSYPAGSLVLEAGCGVGAQTVTLAENSPGAKITCIDISAESLAQAKKTVRAAGFENVGFEAADVFDLPYENDSFDHVFVCFLLEHLRDPDAALISLKRVLRPGGTITVIEGDHGSVYFHPDSEAARKSIQCLIDAQKSIGGDSLIGRRLYPLLVGAGFTDVAVSPRQVYADAGRPHMVDGFTKKTFTAMVEGVRESALDTGLIDAETFDKGIRGLYRTAEPDGTFCYTFFKAVGLKAG